MIVESHPESRTPDLRLDQPWEELEGWLRAQADSMDTMSKQLHGQTPYPVILYRYATGTRTVPIIPGTCHQPVPVPMPAKSHKVTTDHRLVYKAGHCCLKV